MRGTRAPVSVASAGCPPGSPAVAASASAAPALAAVALAAALAAAPAPVAAPAATLAARARVLLRHHANHLLRDAKVLDIIAADDDLGQPPEAIAIS